MEKFLNLVATSDTHGQMPPLPDGDVFIHAGDYALEGGVYEWGKFKRWFESLDYETKIYVPGNHDSVVDRFDDDRCRLLVDDWTVVDGVKFYGMPWTPRYGPWPWMHDRGSDQLRRVVDYIPGDVDVLVTHGPPHGVLDTNTVGSSCGCELLRDRVLEVKPEIHMFGHIHEEGGKIHAAEGERTTYFNVALCNEYLTPQHDRILETLMRKKND